MNTKIEGYTVKSVEVFLSPQHHLNALIVAINLSENSRTNH
jgi:hypothetical protein